MNEPRHTPGPWRACTASDGRCICGLVWSEARDTVIATAEWSGSPDELSTIGSDERVANQHLIAAAPDLLGALYSAALRHEADGPCYCVTRIPAGTAHHLTCQRARAALTKACP